MHDAMPVAITRATDKPAEGNKEVLSEQSEAGFGERSEVLLSGAPWRFGNNCTQTDPRAFTDEVFAER
jgi:hypothetical protein